MVDRIVIMAENGRSTARGLRRETDRVFYAYQRKDESLTYTIDAANLLGSATISSVTRLAMGPTLSGTSNTSTTITQRIKGPGYVDITFTTSASDIHTIRLEIRPMLDVVNQHDYEFVP